MFAQIFKSNESVSSRDAARLRRQSRISREVVSLGQGGFPLNIQLTWTLSNGWYQTISPWPSQLWNGKIEYRVSWHRCPSKHLYRRQIIQASSPPSRRLLTCRVHPCRRGDERTTCPWQPGHDSIPTGMTCTQWVHHLVRSIASLYRTDPKVCLPRF